MAEEINSTPLTVEQTQFGYGQTWTTAQLRNDFEVLQFLAPTVVVRRKSDGVRGTLLFQHEPRIYYSFEPE